MGSPACARISAGTVVGEVGFYIGEKRSASVIAESPSVLWRLSNEALQRMESEAPEMATAFHRFMARLVSERLFLADRIVADLIG